MIMVVFYAAMTAVILGHFYFAYQQWFKWPDLCAELTGLGGEAVEDSAFLGRSIASYNASVGIGLAASFRLGEAPQAWVQGVTLGLIVATAAVGAAGTRGNAILIARLLPAAVALGALIYVQLTGAGGAQPAG